jgi:hypothetical protein
MITVALPFRTWLLFEQLAVEAENDAPAKKWWLQIQFQFPYELLITAMNKKGVAAC